MVITLKLDMSYPRRVSTRGGPGWEVDLTVYSENERGERMVVNQERISLWDSLTEPAAVIMAERIGEERMKSLDTVYRASAEAMGLSAISISQGEPA